MGFDEKGYLTPYEQVDCNLDEFEQLFVLGFPESETRKSLFESYRLYLDSFSALVKAPFQHLIDGSFVTHKLNPRDLDFVGVLDFQTVEKYAAEIQRQFIGSAAQRQFKGLDAYLIKKYPYKHPYFFRYESDWVYWTTWFGKSRMNRAKKRFPKGFLYIQFE